MAGRQLVGARMVMPMKKLLSVVELAEMGRTVVQPLL